MARRSFNLPLLREKDLAGTTVFMVLTYFQARLSLEILLDNGLKKSVLSVREFSPEKSQNTGQLPVKNPNEC